MFKPLVALIVVTAALVSCSPGGGTPTATANIVDPAGKVQGKATFTPEGTGTRVRVNVTGLTPGEHGMHVHVNGACSNTTDATGKTVVFGGAGSHFDPGTSNNHSHPEEVNTKGHGGDMPMIKADANGVGAMEFYTAKVTLSGTNSALNRSIVIHAGPDDFRTQPAGNSGDRVLCGVISAN